jgi:hypothetical protein
VRVEDGMIVCSFTRAKVTILKLPAELGTAEIDLANPFFIALAAGPLDEAGEFIAPHQDQAVSDAATILHQ